MEEYLIETIEYKGLNIKVYADPDAENPRTAWDNFGKMVCFHSRYVLGDKHTFTVEEIQELAQRDDVVALPLYLYDHSGLTMRTYPFSCPWDSGQVGYIYADREMILKEFGGKRLTKAKREKAEKVLKSEVETYDQLLTGQVYGYMVEDQHGQHIDSCWGFFGDPQEYMIGEAKSAADHFIKQLSVNPM